MLGGHRFQQRCLNCVDCCTAEVTRIVVKMSAFAARKSCHARGPEPCALITHEYAHGRIEKLQQRVYCQSGGFNNRKEVSRAWRVKGPAVDRKIMLRIERRRDAVIEKLDATAAIQIHECTFPGEFHESRNFGSRKILRAPQ